MPQTTFSISHRSPSSSLNQLRLQERIPGIMYGQSLKQSLPIQIQLKDLQSIISSTALSTLFTLTLDDTPYECILRTYQPDALHSQILHVDFQYVKPGEVIKMQIPVIYDGTEHLRGQKLLLEKAIDKLPIVGAIDVLPQFFTMNLSGKGKGYKIFAKDLELPQGAELLLPPDTIIATIQ
ncbi:MAG: 50S ribosomal protein L25 [Cellulosilyticaceae bacterium]